jgi:hypothetical protein
MGGGSEREQEVLEALAALTRLEAERERRLNLLDRHAVLRALVDRICDEFGFDVSLVGLVEDQNLVLRMLVGNPGEIVARPRRSARARPRWPGRGGRQSGDRSGLLPVRSDHP